MPIKQNGIPGFSAQKTGLQILVYIVTAYHLGLWIHKVYSLGVFAKQQGEFGKRDCWKLERKRVETDICTIIPMTALLGYLECVCNFWRWAIALCVPSSSTFDN